MSATVIKYKHLIVYLALTLESFTLIIQAVTKKFRFFRKTTKMIGWSLKVCAGTQNSSRVLKNLRTNFVDFYINLEDLCKDLGDLHKELENLCKIHEISHDPTWAAITPQYWKQFLRRVELTNELVRARIDRCRMTSFAKLIFIIFLIFLFYKEFFSQIVNLMLNNLDPFGRYIKISNLGYKRFLTSPLRG